MRQYTATLANIILLAASMMGVQEPAPSQTGSVQLMRFGDLLREHKIELTEPALIAALKNPDASVRFLAAMKLAEDKDLKSIPDVKQALSAERVPRTRVNLAVALGLLGDPGGIDELKKLCADKSFPPEFRLYAVTYTFDLHVDKDEGCLKTAEELAQLVTDDYHTSSYRTTALELLPRFRALTPEESQKILQIVVGRLEDPEPTVRMQAGQSLVVIGNPAVVPELEAALANQKDEAVRSTLQEDLDRLLDQATH